MNSRSEIIKDSNQTYQVKFTLTERELRAMRAALSFYTSPSGMDVNAYLSNALNQAEIIIS
jgi:hypothetical protein